ncbi:MAG: beta/gamma crystallin-related protein [Pyrinomonadaceae bacterium]|nr:beta/gamma crystallin-related protein [Pyrinomonadaceae bacterium]
MRIIRVGLLVTFGMIAFLGVFSSEIIGQEGRLIGGGSGITVFEDRNFRGDAATYQSNMPNLPSRFNNRISSIRVGDGEQWQICDQANYRGQCVTVSGEESDLRRNNWDNRISSMRRISGGGGGGWGGGGTVRPPSWAQGTWYGTAPDGSQIILTISANGSVNASVNGSMSYGTYRSGNLININGATSRVTRNGSGLITTRTDNREQIRYTRSGSGGGWGGWGGGNQISPPSWARGNFVGNAPNGTQIFLTISANGDVSAQIGGSGYVYGSYTSGNYITIDGAVSRVIRNGNGITTERLDNGERIFYTRRSR